MALTASDLAQIKASLGYNTLTIGAIPYVAYLSLFDQVVQPYLQAGAATTSSTAVTASSTPAVVSLALALATGFAAGDRVVVDVDSLQEEATIRSVTGSAISVALSLAHAGTYPVTVVGGETIIRSILRRLIALGTQLDSVAATAGLKRAEDIEWYQSASGAYGGSAQLGGLYAQRDVLRDELAAALGVPNLWRVRKAGATSVALY